MAWKHAQPAIGKLFLIMPLNALIQADGYHAAMVMEDLTFSENFTSYSCHLAL